MTTLGRGGSDTTAVALAHALDADVCEIYTDVDGVYTANPSLVARARKIDHISYDEMLEMAAAGAQVLAVRAVEYARKYDIPIHVRSSFTDYAGTWVREEDDTMESPIIRAVTYTTDEARVTVRGVPDRPGVAAEVFTALAEAHVNVDMIIQNSSEEGHTDISCTIPSEDSAAADRALRQIVADLGAKGFSSNEGIAKVSVIGAGMRTNPGVAAKMFKTLADLGINLDMISTSPIKISAVIARERADEAVRALHDVFGLDESLRAPRQGRPELLLMAGESYTVAIAGATGVVGGTVRRILEERSFPVGELRLLASARSAGRRLPFQGAELEVQELGQGSFEGVDLVFFAAGGDISREYVPQAVAAGATAIDKSSVFRMDPGVPLVVPEVNADHLASNTGIIATPNCSTIQMVVALKPIYDEVGIKRVVVSTYQAVSGSGQGGIAALEAQTRQWAAGEPVEQQFYPYQIAFNALPHIDGFLPSGATKEEQKMVDETTKIFADPDLKVTATCVRVPVFGAHSEAVNVETWKKLTADEARALLAGSPGIVVVDDPAELQYPLPLDAEGADPVFVGRIREDVTIANGLDLWVVSDNLRKGAALNAVQIAEELVRRGLL